MIKKSKQAHDLLLGDKLVAGKRTETVTQVIYAGCSPFKVHIQVEGTRASCYDNEAIVEVSV